MNDIKVYLASASPRRYELLKKSGIEPEVIPSDTDEDIPEKDPAGLVAGLAERKCTDVASRILSSGRDLSGRSAVIGADTVVAVENVILGKPSGEENAAEMLRLLSGRKHDVLTGVCIIFLQDGSIVHIERFVETSVVKVADISESEIRDYIATGEPMDKAGSYGIQGYFARYVEGIEGDYCNIVGLPVCRVYKALRGFLNELQ